MLFVKKLISLVCVIVILMTGCKKKKVDQERMCARIDMERIVELFPKTAEEIELLCVQTQDHMRGVLEELNAVPAQSRSYLNTVLLYEQAYLLFFTRLQLLSALAMLSENAQLQLAANLAVQELQLFQIKNLQGNMQMYDAFSQYETYGKDAYHGTKPVQNFLHHMAQKSIQEGKKLSVDQRNELLQLQQNLNRLSGRFMGNILYDSRNIVVPTDGLAGVPESVVQTLHKDDKGNYILPVNQSLFFNIMENCNVEATRKAYYIMFGQIAYPQNEQVLQDLVAKRQELAQIFGFDTFAEYQVSNLMMKSCKKVEQFLWSFAKDLQLYEKRDYQKMFRHLPEGVTLNSQGKLQPWDDAYVKSHYRKHFFNIDDNALAAYFPLDFVVPAMFKQFQKVFHVTFEEDVSEGLWASDVKCYRVRSLKNQAILGYLLLDLYQRPGKKITDACHLMLIPAIRDDCSIACVGASVIAAQFAAPTESTPTLLEFSDVVTLFHEIGHGLHALFGATRFTMFSGTQVQQDFVETPSVMLEYWFDEPEMLAAISHHYQTGKPLSQSQIEQLLAAQKFGRAGRMLKQVYMAMLSFYIFNNSQGHDLSKMISRLYKKTFHHVAYEPEFHVETSFAHLAQAYGAAYYTYPLSAVIGADLFKHMKQHGLWNYEVGTKYIEDILSPGGSVAPLIMTKRFLGRHFTMNAYLSML